MITNKIIGAFSKEFNRELTINQISKEIKKSYGSVNLHTNELIRQGLIKKKIVGSAILCSLNYENEKVIGYLVLNSIIKSEKTAIPDSLMDTSVIFAFKIRNKTYHRDIKNQKRFGSTNVDDFVFRDLVISSLKNMVIIKGHENFWRKIKEIS